MCSRIWWPRSIPSSIGSISDGATSGMKRCDWSTKRRVRHQREGERENGEGNGDAQGLESRADQAAEGTTRVEADAVRGEARRTPEYDREVGVGLCEAESDGGGEAGPTGTVRGVKGVKIGHCLAGEGGVWNLSSVDRESVGH